MRLMAANGMKTAAEWAAMSHRERCAWLARLDSVGVCAQSSVCAAGAQTTIDRVLATWVRDGYLTGPVSAQAQDARA